MGDQDLHFPVYTPASVLGIFSNALKLNATVNLIYLKGRYMFGGGKAYGNYFYDQLYSEGDNSVIGVRISALLRSKIISNEIYTLKGYVEKSIKNSSIELRFVVDDIIQQEEKLISEAELQQYELVRKKLSIGSKNLEALIRDKMLKGEKVKIANIYGNNAIVQNDFFEGLDVSSVHYMIDNHSCSITSSSSIISKLNELRSLDYDVIALVRGGGDRQSMETFNDVSLSELFLSLDAVTVTAIGHTVDETLLDRLADRRFHLPHDYGAGLHAIAEKLIHEKSNSRAMLINEVKRDVQKQFSEQVETLQTQLKKKNEEFSEAQKIFKEQSEGHQKTFADQLKNRNEEFQKLQQDSSKQLEDMNRNFQEQQKHREAEMENYRREISALHEKTVQSAVREHTAPLQANLHSMQQENARLNTELAERKMGFAKLIFAIIVAMIIGFFLAKIV